MVKQVDQAVLVSVRDDRERQLAVLRKMVRFAAFISFPLLLGFGLVAKEFIVLAIGEKWLVSAHYLQWLCICGAVAPISVLLADLIISHGRSGIFMGATLSLGLLEILAMLLLYPYGIHTMVMAYVALNLVCASRLTSYPILLFLKDIVPFGLAATVVMLTTGYLTASITSLWLLLLCRVVLAAILYLLVMKVARAKILDETLNFVMNKFKR